MATISDERGIGSFAAGVIDSIKDVVVDINGIKQAGCDCYNSASETTTICDTTKSKTTEMINFGLEMKSAMSAFTDGAGTRGSRDITAVSRAISTDDLTAALKTVTEMDDLALACVNQSLKMIDSINAGVDSLPDVLEKSIDRRMENAKQNGSDDGDPALLDLDEDCRELERATDSVVGMNPFTAIDSFQNAFDGIVSKGNLCRDMFETIHAFAKDVSGVSDAIQNFKLGKMVGKIRDLVKDIWRCLRLSDLIRSFAEAAGRLIKWIMKLIQTLKEKIHSFDVDFTSCGCCKEMESLNMNNIMMVSQTILKAFAK